MDYSKEIFKMLDVKPYEMFKIKNVSVNLNDKYIYYLGPNLCLYSKYADDCWPYPSNEFICYLLNGTEEIIKIPQCTTSDKEIAQTRGNEMNYTNQIFKMLGVKPNEVFKVIDNGNGKEIDGTCSINQHLTLNSNLAWNVHTIDLLTGYYGIEKISQYSEEEKRNRKVRISTWI